MTDRETLAAEIAGVLPYFHGTQEWHAWSSLFRNYLLTDGALYVAEKAKAFWLVDAIASYHTNKRVRRETFQVWKLTVDPHSHAAVLVCEDGNNHTVVTQEIELTDFPLGEITLWCIADGDYWVILLPSEY
jgi:hypothetical protein